MERYELFDPIGENHFSKVYSGCDHQANRDVAILVMHDHFFARRERGEEVWNDVLKAVAIRDRNLVPVFDVDPHKHWLLMERMVGNLKVEASAKAIPFDLARSVLRQVLEGLKGIHDAGRLHGDIKPAQILFNQEGRVQLGFSPGFYLAGTVPERPNDSMHMMPELIKPDFFGEICRASDLYMTGFAIAELLAGPSFAERFAGAGHDRNLSFARWHGEPDRKMPKAQTLVDSIPADLAYVIDKLLEKRVVDRFQTVEDVLRELDSSPELRVQVPKTEEPRKPHVPTNLFEAPAYPGYVSPTTTSRHERKPASTTVAAAPFSRNWLNQKLEHPVAKALFFSGLISTFLGIAYIALKEPASQGFAEVVDPISGLVSPGTVDPSPSVDADDGLADEMQQLRLSIDSLAQLRLTDLNAISTDIRQLNQRLADSREDRSLFNNDLPDISASLLSLENAIKELEASTRGNNSQQRELVDALAVLKSQLSRYAVGTSESAPDLTPPLQLAQPLQGLDPKDNQGLSEPQLDPPMSADALAGAATRKLGVGDFDGAIADIEAAMKADPSNMTAWRKVAFDVHLAMGIDRLDAKANQDAVQAFSTAMNFADSSMQKAMATGNRSVAYLRSDLVDAAIRDFEQASQFDAGLANQWSGELASAYRLRGLNAYRNKDYKSAEIDLTTAIRMGVNDGESLAMLAACQYQDRNYQDAATTFGRAFDQSSDLNKTWGAVAADAFYRRGLTLTDSNPTDAIEDFSKSITLQPTKIDAIAGRAELYRRASDWKRAADDYSMAISIQDDPSLYAGRAVCRLQSSELDAALGDYEKAIKGGFSFDQSDRTSFAKAFVERGIMNYNAQRYDDTIVDCGKAMMLDRRSVEAPMLSGSAQLKLGDFGAALKDFDEAILISRDEHGDRLPKDIVLTAVYGRGTANLELARYDRAERDFDETIKVAPDFATAHLKRGIALQQSAKHREALDSLDEAVRLNDRSYSALNNRGACLLNLREYADAIRDFTRAIQIDGAGANAYYNRSIAYRRLGMDTKANADLVKARQLDPSIDG